MTLLNCTVKQSDIEGRGLFADAPLAAGEVVVEYTGEKIDQAESARRLANEGRIFIFELEDDFYVDGSSPDNPARFANHSCEPNCEAIAANGRISLRTIRRVNPGEELTFDYGFPLSVFPGHPCRCGAKTCCGFIVNQTDRWRVRQLLNRPGRSLLPAYSAIHRGGYA